MRFAIFFSALMICKCLNLDVYMGYKDNTGVSFFVIVFILMDLIDFFRGK